MYQRTEVTAAAPAPAADRPRPRKTTLAYQALLIFTIYYFLRPEDFIPGLRYIPWGKITGGIAILGVLLGLPSKDRPKLPLEIKILLLLLLHMVLTVPFAFWITGSARLIVNEFSKAVIVGVLVFYAVTNFRDLRRLMYTQAALVAFVALSSLAVHKLDNAGRLMGLQQGVLENPNDLAINIAINFPLCMAFMLRAKAGFKVLWGLALLFMMYAVVATYSRSGVLSLGLTVLICLWEFGVKGRRTYLLAATVFIGMAGVVVVFTQPHYLARLETLVKGGDVEGGQDKGTLEARSTLLKKAIIIAFEHPVFGVGPGNYQVVSDEWHVVHNSYAELAAETGFPGLILFLVLLWACFRKLGRIRKLPVHQTDPDLELWTSALWASLAAYATGSLFASTEYNLFPYFIVGYICALYTVAAKAAEVPGGKLDEGKLDRRNRTRDANGKRELVWSR